MPTSATTSSVSAPTTTTAAAASAPGATTTTTILLNYTSCSIQNLCPGKNRFVFICTNLQMRVWLTKSCMNANQPTFYISKVLLEELGQGPIL